MREEAKSHKVRSVLLAVTDLYAACEKAIASNPLMTGKPQMSIDMDAWEEMRAAVLAMRDSISTPEPTA